MSELLNKIIEDNKDKNCYGCKYKRGVAGSTHSQCRHPVVLNIEKKVDVFNALLWFSMVRTNGNINPTGVSYVIKDDEGNEIDNLPIMQWDTTGIRNGYVQYPYDLDPAWLVYCLMREEVSNE